MAFLNDGPKPPRSARSPAEHFVSEVVFHAGAPGPALQNNIGQRLWKFRPTCGLFYPRDRLGEMAAWRPDANDRAFLPFCADGATVEQGAITTCRRYKANGAHHPVRMAGWQFATELHDHVGVAKN
jgi:hypothetical protein